MLSASSSAEPAQRSRWSPSRQRFTRRQRSSATEKADRSRQRQQRLVWIRDGDLLRAVPVTLGLIENQFAELVKGALTQGQEVVTGTETGGPK